MDRHTDRQTMRETITGPATGTSVMLNTNLVILYHQVKNRKDRWTDNERGYNSYKGCTRLDCSGTALNVVATIPVVPRIEQGRIKTWWHDNVFG